MPGSILGNRVRRVEDPELLLGRGRYVGDIAVPGLAHVVFVRSPIAHARITGIDIGEAAHAPGVLAVYTAADLGLPVVHGLMVLNPAAGRPPLAVDQVRFVGDTVVAVVAETRAEAVDAAELVVVDYDPLDAVVDPELALAAGAPLQFEDMGTNLAAGFRDPDGPDPLAGAAHVVRARIDNQRVAVVPMETNAITVVPGDDGDGHELTIWISTQMPHGFHGQVCTLFELDAERIRVVAPYVGGAFGAKVGAGAEHVVVIAAARRLNRPLAWSETRSETLVATPHGRGQVDYIEMGFDEEARITGMHCRVISDAGAYAGFGGALALGPTRMMAQGVYRIPTIPAGAGHGPGRRRAGHRSRRAAPTELARPRRIPADHRHGHDL
jgi:carbon-monoxide dehydrogenase large subunit